MKVLVLCGGESAERVVSLASGDTVAAWLAEAGYDAVKYDPEAPGRVHPAQEVLAPEAIGLTAPLPVLRGDFDPSTVRGLLDVIENEKPDLVFPILHGGRGEDGTLQALLDWVGIPYAGSGPMACALAMNKHYSRTMFECAGLPVTAAFIVPLRRMRETDFVVEQIEKSFGYPAVVKPMNGGSTIGLTKVLAAEDVADALKAVRALEDNALVESHFHGREIAAAVVADEAYPLVEIKPRAGFYDYANKYTSGRTEYVCPADIPAQQTTALQEAAVQAYRALGCRGFARVDLLLAADGRFVVLELNTLPGMTKNSLVPKAARARGIEPPQLMTRIVQTALQPESVTA